MNALIMIVFTVGTVSTATIAATIVLIIASLLKLAIINIPTMFSLINRKLCYKIKQIQNNRLYNNVYIKR